MFEGIFAPSHLIIVAIAVVVLFGYNKLPDVTRSVGRSLRIFKTEMKGLQDDDKVRDDAEAQGQTTAAPAVTPVPVTPVAVSPVPVAPPAVPAAVEAPSEPAGVAPVAATGAEPVPSDDEIARAQAVLAAAAKARADVPVHAGAAAPERADTSAH